jgi:hypothetical protein
MPERPCVPVGQAVCLPVLVRLRAAACCHPPVARCSYRDRVLLLTDGQGNHGIVDSAVLVRNAAELSEEGMTTTTMGYGEDFNDNLLTVLTGFTLSVLNFSFPDTSFKLPAALVWPMPVT